MPRDKAIFKGWRLGVLLNALSAVVVFAINLGVTLWAVSAVPTPNGIGEERRRLFQASCADVKRINVVGHALINTLSTVLLSASNYCMQCLVAPTRKEVDRAHTKKRWVDIGTPSVRNLAQISPQRVALWFLLAISSLPLHLFYNSALFSTFDAAEYAVLAVLEEFTQSGGPPTDEPLERTGTDSAWKDQLIADLHDKALAGSLERLDAVDCFNAYMQPFQAARSNLVLVLGPTNDAQAPLPNGNVVYLDLATYSYGGAWGFVQAYEWVCNPVDQGSNPSGIPCEVWLSEIRSNISSGAGWVYRKYPVEYCLSETSSDLCTLNFNTTIAIIVLAINVAKAIGIVLVFWAIREKPLVNIGDAIGSFLEVPDETTKGLGLVAASDFKQETSSKELEHEWPVGPKLDPISDTPRRWQAAVGIFRMVLSVTFYVLLIGICFSLFGWSVNDLQGAKDMATVWSIGFGTIDNRTLVTGLRPASSGTVPMLTAILLANLPQAIISGAYFLYNSLFTMMSTAAEWDRFAVKRKGLRVSSAPMGAQRSSHFLQLPYKFAVPMMAMSGVLHWAASQAIFIVDVEYKLAKGLPAVKNRLYSRTTTLGYSPLAIFIFTWIAVGMIGLLIVLSRTKFKSAMPVAGNCSGAISAACHNPAPSVPGIAQLPLQWGEVVTGDESQRQAVSGEAVRPNFTGERLEWPYEYLAYTGGEQEGLKRRCAFSHAEVQPPVEGVIYL